MKVAFKVIVCICDQKSFNLMLKMLMMMISVKR